MAARRLGRSGSVALAGVLLLVGCSAEGGDGAEPDEPAATAETGQEASTEHSLEWDLREGHSLDDVDWPSDTTAFELTGGVQTELLLPGDRTYADRVRMVMGRRIDDQVSQLQMSYPPTTTEEAYTQAQELGEQWDVDMQNIDDWYERRMAQREEGGEQFTDTAATGGVHSEPLGGEDGPKPGVKVMNTFNDERPVSVQFSLVWPRE